MPLSSRIPRRPAGIGTALLAAALFGVSTPFAKLLSGRIDPVALAGLFYLGSGIGLAVVWAVRHATGNRGEAPLVRSDVPWLSGAVLFGGVLGPVLLMLGIRATPASVASLLLNLEAVFTALLAWFLFRENWDRRIALGMLAIVAGGVLLSWKGAPSQGIPWGALAVVGACFCWGMDNNLTQKVSAGDPVQIAGIKGVAAGTVNLGIALLLGARLPALATVLLSGLVGFLGYGVSLVLFVLALRQLGTARTGAYFALAPFLGAAVSALLLREPLGPWFLVGGALMGFGVWLHVTEHHEHEHAHEPMEHEHRHVHDAHHQHEHPEGVDPEEPHSHPHRHARLIHRHPHYPDLHHRHGHGEAA